MQGVFFTKTVPRGRNIGGGMAEKFVAVDIETTGLNPTTERIIEIGAVSVENGKITGEFDMLINPGRQLSSFITGLTGITDAMLENALTIQEALPHFLEFVGEDILLGHHLSFDYSFLKKNIVNIRGNFERLGMDTLKIARKALPGLESYSLSSLCGHYHIKNVHAHRACDDARATVELYFCLKEECYGKEIDSLFAPKQLICRVKKESPITDAQVKYLYALLDYHKIDLKIQAESLTKSEASRIIDGIILNYGKIPGRR